MKFTVATMLGLTAMAALFCGFIAMYPQGERLEQAGFLAAMWAVALLAIWLVDRLRGK